MNTRGSAGMAMHRRLWRRLVLEATAHIGLKKKKFLDVVVTKND